AAAGKRCAPADGDVGVLAHEQGLEAAILQRPRQLGDVDAVVGREVVGTYLHAVSPAIVCRMLGRQRNTQAVCLSPRSRRKGRGGEVGPVRGRRSRTMIRAGQQARAVAARPAARLGRFLVRGAALAALAALKVLTGALRRLALVATYRVALLAAIDDAVARVAILVPSPAVRHRPALLFESLCAWWRRRDARSASTHSTISSLDAAAA